MSLWEAGETTPRPELAAKLEETLGIDAGKLTRLLGFVPAAVQRVGRITVLEAIDIDPRLSEGQRDALTRVYREFVAEQDEQLGHGHG